MDAAPHSSINTVQPDLVEEFFAISVERRITHPCVTAITEAARNELFAPPARRRPRRAA